MLLQKMLKKLKGMGHRVLIFSQVCVTSLRLYTLIFLEYIVAILATIALITAGLL